MGDLSRAHRIKSSANSITNNMDDKYVNILVSKPYKFIVGPQKKEFIMHEAAVAKLSNTLHKLLHGGMRETQERCVCWEDTDEKTFLHFGEWAYTGDYKPEAPEILLDASQIASTESNLWNNAKKETAAKSLASYGSTTEDEESRAEDEESTSCNRCGNTSMSTVSVQCVSCGGVFGGSRCNRGICMAKQYSDCLLCRTGTAEWTKKQYMIEIFNSNDEYASPTTLHTPRNNAESCENYSEVFLSHARLYVLADKYDIPELRSLSVHKLYVTLKEFALYPERMGDIIALVKYSFKNTMEGDKLRALMAEYCACIVEDMCKDKEFQELINEAPDFASELIKRMSFRLD